MEDFVIPAMVSVAIAILLYFVMIDLLVDALAIRVIGAPWSYKVQLRLIRYLYLTTYTTTFFMWLGLSIYTFSLFN